MVSVELYSRFSSIPHPQNELPLGRNGGYFHTRKATQICQIRSRQPAGESSRFTFAFDERAQYSFQRYISFPGANLATFELDPSFIEAIEHLNTRDGVPHSLRFE